MNVSNRLIQKIKEFEGCKLTAYKCPAGVWTIGVGHTKGVKQGQVITMAQAERLLKNDLRTFERLVSVQYPAANQNQFDALVDLAFNCGNGAVLGNLRTLIKKGSSKEAIQKWWQTHYITAGGVKMNGLVKRRKWESEVYFE